VADPLDFVIHAFHCPSETRCLVQDIPEELSFEYHVGQVAPASRAVQVSATWPGWGTPSKLTPVGWSKNYEEG